MARKKKETGRVDELLDDLLVNCPTSEDVLGESGLLKQLSRRLIERALAGELNHHLRPRPLSLAVQLQRVRLVATATMATRKRRFSQTQRGGLGEPTRPQR